MKHKMDNEEKKDDHKHSLAKHMLHMVICCALPILIIIILPFIAKFSPRIATALGFIAPFICPLMMGGMIILMFGGR